MCTCRPYNNIMVTNMYYTNKDQMTQLANNTRANKKNWQYCLCKKNIKRAIKDASPSPASLDLRFICLALQMADIYLPLVLGATVYFAEPDALKVS